MAVRAVVFFGIRVNVGLQYYCADSLFSFFGVATVEKQ